MHITPLLKALFSLLVVICFAATAAEIPSDEQLGITDTAHSPNQCYQHLKASRMQTYRSQFIVPKQIRLLTWNIYKAQNVALFNDLKSLNSKADILLLQEAIEDLRLTKLKPYWRFSPGYKSGDTQTGVMTLSRWPATVHCTLTHKEPWLRSPKATNIVEYAMAGQQRLLSVNMHGINFTLGTEDYTLQLQDSLQIMSQHKGPIIFAGDLNAWSDARQQIIVSSLTKLGLTEAPYFNDKRTKAFGLALDQVWTRGISITNTLVKQYESSDHNPILVTLELNEEKL